MEKCQKYTILWLYLINFIFLTKKSIMAQPKRFKPKNPEDYIELKPGILVRKDRTKDVIRNPQKKKKADNEKAATK